VLVAALREAGLRADRAYGDRSVKAQWKLADRARAAFGVMLGREEAGREAVAVKDLASGKQLEVPREQVAGWIRARCEEASAS
jgi:histidyl-tRNA synthetase